MKLSGPGLLFVGRFLIIDSVPLLIIGMFIFSIFHDSVIVGCIFLGIYSSRFKPLSL